jgi:prolyl oligopeptidase
MRFPFQLSKKLKMKFNYPSAFRDLNCRENLHGHEISDPYRWLEDPDAPETAKFVTNQNKITRDFLSQSSIRQKFKDKLTDLMNYPKQGCPKRHGNYYYYFYNSGLLPQNVIYRQESLESEPEVFFDPNTLSEDGTISLSTYKFSESGKYFAYALSESGSDWVKIYVRSTEKGATQPIDEPLLWAKFTSIGWTHDDKGFFYNTFPAPNIDEDKAGTETASNKNCSIKYHQIGTPQSTDIMFYTDKENPEVTLGVTISDDGKYLLVSTYQNCDPANKLYICNLQEYIKDFKRSPEFIKLVDNFEFEYTYVANDDSVFWLQTTLNAPKSKIVKFDLKNFNGYTEVIAETENVISFVDVADKFKLIIARLQDVKHVVEVYSLYTGEFLFQLPLPVGSMIGGLSCKRNMNIIFYSFSSFTTPGIIYKYDFQSNTSSVFRETKVEGLC